MTVLQRASIGALFCLLVAVALAAPSDRNAVGQAPGTPGNPIAVPGSVSLAAHASAAFASTGPGSVTPVIAFTTFATNFSDRVVTVAAAAGERGVNFTLAAEPGATVVALNGSCFAVGATDNVVSCANIFPPALGAVAQLDFTVVAPGDLPVTSATLAAGEVATLLRPETAGRHMATPASPPGFTPPVYSPIPVLGLRRLAARITGETLQTASVEWTDQGVTIAAPAGYLPVCSPHPERCTALAGRPGVVRLDVVEYSTVIEFSIEDRPLPAALQALPAPGSTDAPPGGTVSFVYPLPPGTQGNHRVVSAVNAGDRYARVSADADALIITAPTGFVVTPDAECTASADRPNAAVCPLLPRPVTFFMADSSAVESLPRKTTLAVGTSTTFVAQDADGNTLALTVQYSGTAFSAEPAYTIDISWDGAALTAAAPEGYVLSGGGPGITCEPLDDRSTALSCPASGRPAQLFNFTTRNLNPGRFLPATPPGPLFAEISSPAPGGRVIQKVGAPVTFTAMARVVPLPAVWDFGDGTLAAGASVTHSYSTPGIYTATLIYFSLYGHGSMERRLVVPVGVPPVQVTYSAGWNLVGGPTDTLFAGALGPLYYLPWPPHCFGPGPSPAPTAVETPAQGTVFSPPPNCDDGYTTVPAEAAVNEFGIGGTAPAAGHGYWALFPRTTTLTLPFHNNAGAAAVLPGGRFIMVANPGFRPATVQGADAVYVYDPTTRQYRQTTTLQPGQGAWAYAALTGELSFVEQSSP